MLQQNYTQWIIWQEYYKQKLLTLALAAALFGGGVHSGLDLGSGLFGSLDGLLDDGLGGLDSLFDDRLSSLDSLLDHRLGGLDGLFDDGQLFAAIARRLRAQKGVSGEEHAPVSFEDFREREFDRIAAIVRASLDMDAIYRIVRGEV